MYDRMLDFGVFHYETEADPRPVEVQRRDSFWTRFVLPFALGASIAFNVAQYVSPKEYTVLPMVPASKSKLEASSHLLTVDKSAQKATLYATSVIDSFDVSTGRNVGDKKMSGDNRTPDGLFRIVSVEKSADWEKDGRQVYGDFFLRLDAGFWGRDGRHYPEQKSPIGIHGTNEPQLLGSRASDGCIRMPNELLSMYVSTGVFKSGLEVLVHE